MRAMGVGDQLLKRRRPRNESTNKSGSAARMANIELGENQYTTGSANLQTQEEKVSRAEAAALIGIGEWRK